MVKSRRTGMTEDDIRRATAAALAAKPVVIGLKRLKKPAKPKWLLGEEDVGDEPVDPDQVKDEDGLTEAQEVGDIQIWLNTLPREGGSKWIRAIILNIINF